MRTLQQGLSEWAKKNNLKVRQGKHRKEKKTKPPKEKLSYRDIQELMGINKPVYRRGKGGSFQQR
jgi:hypothetical protein